MDLIFNLIMQSLIAFIQIIMILVGSLFSLFGLLFFKDAMQNKANKKWLKATLVSLRIGKGIPDENGSVSDVYFPVYEVIGENGAPIRYESQTGTSNFEKFVIGSRHLIRPLPDSPGFASAQDEGAISVTVGAFLIGMGGAMLAISLGVMPFSQITIPVWICAAIYFGIKFASKIKPKNMRETVAQFRNRKATEHIQKQQALPEISAHDVEQKMAALEPARRIMQRVSIITGFAILVTGGMGYNAQQDFIGKSTLIKESPCSPDISAPDCRKTKPLEDVLSLLPPQLRPEAQGIYKSPQGDGKIIVDYGPYTPAPYYVLMGLGALILQSAVRASSRKK